MQTAKSIIRCLAIAAIVVGVGACALFEKPLPPLCPEVNILANADRLSLFREGEGRDLTDILFEVDFEGYVVGCEYDLDDDTQSGQLFVELQVAMAIQRGPADKDRRAEIPYFVVLRDASDGALLEKSVFNAAAQFNGNQRQVGVLDDPVELTIPIYSGRSGADFTILLGLQLTEDQLNFNRHQGRQ